MRNVEVMKTLRLGAVPAEMRNENHLNTNLERHQYISLLRVLVLKVQRWGGGTLPFKACLFKSCDAALSN
jgi:hypothetical protein